jgi:hypothetical protein
LTFRLDPDPHSKPTEGVFDLGQGGGIIDQIGQHLLGISRTLPGHPASIVS